MPSFSDRLAMSITPVLYNQATVGAAYVSSASATDVSTNPQYVLPPNTVTTAGQVLRLRAAGMYSSTGTPTLTLGFYINTTPAAAATGVGGVALAVLPATLVTGSAWMLDVRGVVAYAGPAGAITCRGIAYIEGGDSPIVIASALPQRATNFDTTRPNLLTVGATWSVNSVSNTLVCNTFTISLMS